MEVIIYIEKNDFDEFLKWVRKLRRGTLSSPPIMFSHLEKDIKDPLKVSLDRYEYCLISDVKEDLRNIERIHGPIDLTFEPDTQAEHLQRIKESLRNAKREDQQIQLIYAALQTMKELPDLTPTEAIIIAERSLLLST